jgi:hypothetical protein
LSGFSNIFGQEEVGNAETAEGFLAGKVEFGDWFFGVFWGVDFEGVTFGKAGKISVDYLG